MQATTLWVKVGVNYVSDFKDSWLHNATPHTLRCAATTHIILNGADIRAAQYFLRHRDIENTCVNRKGREEGLRGGVELIFLLI